MKLSNTYDLIVIGAGSGGLNIASAMNHSGFNVLLIDKNSKSIGGDCLNTGCIPSKAFLHVAKIVHAGEQSKRFGPTTRGSVDIKKVTDYIKERQSIIRETENVNYLKSKGIQIVLGRAKFISSNSIVVGKKLFVGKNIVIATGSRPRQLKVPGVEKGDIYTNEEIFDISFLPKKLLVVGGGPIGFEIGQAFNYLGSKVTITNRSFAFLPKEDADIRNILVEKMRNDGVEFLANTSIDQIKSKKKVVVNQGGKKKVLNYDAIFVAIGRELNISNLGLEKAGIQMKDGKIVLNKYLQTTNKNVFVCGDAVGGYQFTHAAEKHAEIIFRNFFSPIKKEFNEDDMAWVTYTDPEIATFGLRPEELSVRGIPYKVLSIDFTDDDRAIVDDYQNSKAKVFVDRGGRILGGSIIAPHAGELVSELILAQKYRIKLRNLFFKIYPYPTASRINKKLSGVILVSNFNLFFKKVLKWLYRF